MGEEKPKEEGRRDRWWKQRTWGKEAENGWQVESKFKKKILNWDGFLPEILMPSASRRLEKKYKVNIHIYSGLENGKR